MVKIYTKKGDQGQTSLGDGERVAKSSLRVVCYGTIDEANATLGLCRLYTQDNSEIDAMLERIQHELFDLGAELCLFQSTKTMSDSSSFYLGQEHVTRLEHEIDSLAQQLPPLRAFIIPGGTPAGAHLHLARTIIRRAERMITELATQESISSIVLCYINRLSDHLFMVSRAVNRAGMTQEPLYRRS